MGSFNSNSNGEPEPEERRGEMETTNGKDKAKEAAGPKNRPKSGHAMPCNCFLVLVEPLR